MQLGTALNLPNPRINFGGTGRAPGKGNTAIFSFETGVLDSRINFSRTTNATVTNSAGQITYAPHNLLTYSEQFDNAAWTKTTTTVAANAIASPVSTTTGDTLTAGGANSTTLHSYTAIAQPYTFSIYIRRRTGTGAIEITADGSTYVAKTITSDWARYDTTITPTAGTRTPGVRIVTSGDAIDVWGAQLEIGSTATTYNSTTVKNLLGYSELFDNAAWTKSNSFVQTNLLTYSEDFTVAGWAKTTVTATANSFIAPNGYQTADTLLATGANSTALQTFTASAVPYTFSVYLYRKTGTGNIDITVDGTTWVTKTITAGWTRVDTTLTPAAGAKTAGIRIVTSGDEVYAWGAQLVQGSVAGDYRRTDAAALPVYYPNHNGVVCAEKLVENTVNTFHVLTRSETVVNGGKYTISLYVKAGERTWVDIAPAGLAHGDCWFNLETGTKVSTGSAVTSANIFPAGNGWYRCTITYVSTSTSSGITVVPSQTGSVIAYQGDGTSGIYIFGAQLSDSASLDPYVLNAGAAPTAAAYYGPRFDYDPVTLAPKGLLIEEQRQNLLLNSAIAGTNLATQNVTVTAVAHTLSFYGTGSITLSGTASATLTGSGAYPTRSTLTFTPTAGTLTLTVSGTVQYAQLEIGSFATSYIPTGASQTTRAADVATIQGSNFYSWYNQNEGSMFANASSGNIAAGVYPAVLSARQSNLSINYLQMIYLASNTNLSFEVASNSANQALVTVVGTAKPALNKMAGGYKVNDFQFAVNNTLGTADTSGIIPIIEEMTLGRLYNNTNYWNGHIKQISYYPQRLSNDVLKGLTA